MKIEKLDRVCINVKNLSEAERFFADLFGVTFEEVSGKGEFIKTITDYANCAFEQTPIKVAMSPIGLELIETTPPTEKEGVRSFHLKVSNLEQAKAEMREKGIRLLAEVKHGGLSEAIFNPDDLHGIRLVLVEYGESNPISAILQK